MATSSLIRFFLSTDGLGGPITSIPLGSDLFPNVTGLEAERGITDYACVYVVSYVEDERGLIDPGIWFSYAKGPGMLEIGWDPAGKNETAQTIATRFDEPLGVKWQGPISEVLPMYLPTSPYRKDDRLALWIKREVYPRTEPGESRFRFRIRGEAF